MNRQESAVRTRRISIWTILGAIALALLTAIVALAISLFTFGPFQSVSITNPPPVAAPPVLGAFAGEPAVANADAWRRRRQTLQRAFAEHVYGAMPQANGTRVLARTRLAPAQAGGVKGVEQWELALDNGGKVHLALVLPDGEGPFPTIIVQHYCGNRASFPGRPGAIVAPNGYVPPECGDADLDPVHHALFGRWILGPPFELVAQHGYALALFYGGDIAPDAAADAAAALARLGASDTGVIAAWAWMQSRIVDVLGADPRFDPSRMIAFGHSRYGKAALLAGAFDERIAAVIALQSGRGGDALTRHRAGESVASITHTFPHWFSRNFSAFAERDPPVDQHQLLALLAPRPVLLGYKRRDGWADPTGGVGAIEGAKPAYELLGGVSPEYFVRPGTHGVDEGDWRTALDFLDRRVRRLVSNKSND